MDTTRSVTKNRSSSHLDYHTIYSVEAAVQHMTRKRSEAEQHVYIAADEVLFNVWDALCLSIGQEYRDEYLPYLPHVFDLLKDTQDGQDIFNYLLFVEKTLLGTIPGDTLPAGRAARTIETLMEYRDSVLNRDHEKSHMESCPHSPE